VAVCGTRPGETEGGAGVWSCWRAACLAQQPQRRAGLCARWLCCHQAGCLNCLRGLAPGRARSRDTGLAVAPVPSLPVPALDGSAWVLSGGAVILQPSHTSACAHETRPDGASPSGEQRSDGGCMLSQLNCFGQGRVRWVATAPSCCPACVRLGCGAATPARCCLLGRGPARVRAEARAAPARAPAWPGWVAAGGAAGPAQRKQQSLDGDAKLLTVRRRLIWQRRRPRCSG